MQQNRVAPEKYQPKNTDISLFFHSHFTCTKHTQYNVCLSFPPSSFYNMPCTLHATEIHSSRFPSNRFILLTALYFCLPSSGCIGWCAVGLCFSFDFPAWCGSLHPPVGTEHQSLLRPCWSICSLLVYRLPVQSSSVEVWCVPQSGGANNCLRCQASPPSCRLQRLLAC